MSGVFSRLQRMRGGGGAARVTALVTAFVAATSAGSVWADCKGADLRDTLPAALVAEVEAEVARAPYAKGLSWLARREGRELRIIGTMHLNDPRHAPLVAHMAPAIERADVMLVEVTTAEKAAMQRDLGHRPEMIYITEGPSLIERMSEAEWQQIAALAKEAGIPPFMAAKMRPWFLSLSLSIPNCARTIKDVAEGLDAQLLEIAAQKGIETRSLEDPLSVFQTLNADPLDTQVAELRSYLAMMQVGEDEFSTMLDSYFEGEAYAFSLLQKRMFLAADFDIPVAEREAQIDTLMDTLLIERNKAWVPVIEATEGEQLVIAVGAAHLPGPDGLLELLAAEGYAITEVPL